jgi:uncharacterized SAM-binding protein YcdF (DUF218 family)
MGVRTTLLLGTAFAAGVWGMNQILNPPPPQAILVLGGDAARDRFAAQFARRHADLPVWISSGSNPEYAHWVFQQAGVPLSRLKLDYRAVDTVSNFTSVVGDLQHQQIRSVYLITSDYHMPRAALVGRLVLGSRGISFVPVTVPSELPQEPLTKTVRDGARALFWIVTGRATTGLHSLRAMVFWQRLSA